MRRILAAIPGFVGLVILAAWYFNIETVQRLGLSSVSMNPMTAVCFALLATALVLSESGARHDARFRTALALMGVVAIIATLKLLDVFAGVRLGIDTTLFASQLEDSRWT